MSLGKRDKQLEERIAQFCAVTGASVKDAKKYLDKNGKRLEVAIDAFYNDSASRRQDTQTSPPSTSKLNQLFDAYKDPDGEDISVDGTIRLCQDAGSDPEDVVWLAVAYELKSPGMGEWTRKGWVDGWKKIGCDSIATMQAALLRLRGRLGSDSAYFQQVYNYAFEFSRPSGQRSLAMDMALGFWGILIPHGLQGGALSHIPNQDGDGDDTMTGTDEGWQDEHTQWWFEYLTEKGQKGVSKDVWHMFLEFVRTIDSKFEKYDAESAWPSAIDDFVEYARGRIAAAH